MFNSLLCTMVARDIPSYFGVICKTYNELNIEPKDYGLERVNCFNNNIQMIKC